MACVNSHMCKYGFISLSTHRSYLDLQTLYMKSVVDYWEHSNGLKTLCLWTWQRWAYIRVVCLVTVIVLHRYVIVESWSEWPLFSTHFQNVYTFVWDYIDCKWLSNKVQSLLHDPSKWNADSPMNKDTDGIIINAKPAHLNDIWETCKCIRKVEGGTAWIVWIIHSKLGWELLRI